MRWGGDGFDVEAVIFDLDGTLIDSAGIYFKIIEIVFDRLAFLQPAREAIIKASESGDFDWGVVFPDDVKDRKDEITAKALDIITEIAPPLFQAELEIIPGADDLLREIVTAGLKVGVVTSTSRRYLEIKLEPLRKAGVATLLEVIITTDDVQNKKPAADPLIECGKILAVDLRRSVYVGDTRVDMRAGKAAGMKTIGVLTGFDDYESLKAEKPDAILNSVGELRKIFF